MDLGDQQTAVGEWRVAVRTAICPRGVDGTGARSTPLADDLLGMRYLEDPAVPDVGDDDVTVRQRVGIVRSVQPARTRSRVIVPAVLPDDPSRRDVDADDDL